MSKKREQLKELAEGVLEDFSSSLYLLKWEKRGGEWVLELLIDDEGQVTTSDCADVSGRVSDELDRRDLIQKEYVLQVSSPGVERPLIKARHYQSAIGGSVEVNTYGPIGNSRNFVGTLKSYDEENGEIELEVDGKFVNIPLDNVSKATTRMVDLDSS
ncbi:ribosome maturation factor RimP [Candidatus Bipolaricaulota bacterium]|nr:ribosome maturation factor RimP [Candidatus Bipolaricaulota bacterium]